MQDDPIVVPTTPVPAGEDDTHEQVEEEKLEEEMEKEGEEVEIETS